MKAAKIKKNNKVKEEKVVNEEYSIKQMIIITLIIVVILGIFYFITTLVVKPVYNNIQKQEVNLNLTEITLNNLFNKKEKEYYVIAIKSSLHKDSKVNYLNLYNSYILDYLNKEGSTKFYSIDLDDAFNKGYMSDKLNISNNLEELKINDEILFKIKEGKIDKYITGSENILKELSKLKES